MRRSQCVARQRPTHLCIDTPSLHDVVLSRRIERCGGFLAGLVMQKLIDLSARIVIEDSGGVSVVLTHRLYTETHFFKTLDAARSFVVQWTQFHLTEVKAAPFAETPRADTARTGRERRTVPA